MDYHVTTFIQDGCSFCLATVLLFVDKNSMHEKNVQVKVGIMVDEYHLKMHPITRITATTKCD